MSISNIFKNWWQNIQSFLLYSENLDPVLGLRGFASFVIIWFHLGPPRAWLFMKGFDLSFIITPAGAMAVYIFYLISGYSIGYGFFSKKYTVTLRSLRSFYINRWLRIAPAYYVCILLSIFVFYPRAAVTAYDIVRYFTFTANFDYLNLPFQHLLAIISTEMQFYLIAPVLYAGLSFVIRKMKPLMVGALILCLGAGIRYALFSAGLVPNLSMYMLHVYVTVWGMIDYFLFGMLLSYIVCERPLDVIDLKKRISPLFYNAILISWLLWVNYSNYLPIHWPEYAIHHLFILPPTLCIIIGWYILSSSVNRTYTTHPRSVSRILNLLIHPGTFLYGIGFISYGLYLYHYVFIDLTFVTPGHVGGSMQSFLVRVITIFIMTGITALASLRFVEYPFLKLKNRKP